MRFQRPGLVAVVVALALTVAAAGAVVNLRLLEPRGPSRTPIVLGVHETNPADTGETTTSTTTAATSTSTTVPPPTTSTTTQSAEPPRTYVVGEGGTVVLGVRDGAIVLSSVVPSAGWTAVVEEQRTDEVEVSFRRADGEGETSLHATLHSGEARVEIDAREGDAPDD